MGITTTKTTTYTCDRCGFHSEDEMACGGYANIQYELVMRAYDGAIGGTNSSVWLCGNCMGEFRGFLKGERQ